MTSLHISPSEIEDGEAFLILSQSASNHFWGSAAPISKSAYENLVIWMLQVQFLLDPRWASLISL